MDYKKQYKQLVNTRVSLRGHTKPEDGEYYERHHIVPRSFGGSDEPENLVVLTAKEHLIAHHLLYKIYGAGKMGSAYWMMTSMGKHKVTPRQYASARKALAASHSILMTGTRQSDEHKEKIASAKIKPVNIYDYKTGELVAEGVSMTHWSKENGVQKSALSLTASYKRKHTMGFYARFVADCEKPLKGVKMIKQVYTLATDDLEILDSTAITTLEVAEKLRDRIRPSKVFCGVVGHEGTGNSGS